MSPQDKAVEFLNGIVSYHPSAATSLKQVLQELPFQRVRLNSTESLKQWKVSLLANLLTLWLKYRKDFNPSSEQTRKAKDVLNTIGAFSLGQETEAYLLSRFRATPATLLNPIIINYSSNLVAFFEECEDGETVELLQHIQKMRSQRPEGLHDPYLFCLNFVLAAYDLLQLTVIAISSIEKREGRYIGKEEAKKITEGLIPLVLTLSSHHNAVSAQMFRFILGDCALSRDEVFDYSCNKGKYVFKISASALRYIVGELMVCASMGVEILKSTPRGKRIDRTIDKMYDLGFFDGNLPAADDPEDRKFDDELFRAKSMAVETLAGTEVTGCPLTLAKDQQGRNGMFVFLQEVFSQVIDALYRNKENHL
jgi:hypothetical protein